MKTMAREETWEVLVEQAKQAGRDRNLVKSAATFEKAYELSRSFELTDPRRGDSAYYLGYSRFVQKRKDEAYPLFEEVLKFFWPTEEQAMRIAGVCSFLGDIEMDRENWAEAERRFRDALQLQEKHGLPTIKTVALIATMLLRQEKYAESAVFYEKLSGLQRGKASQKEIKDSLKYLAFAHSRAGNLAEEMKWRKESLKLYGGKPQHPVKVRPIERINAMPLHWGGDAVSNYVDAAQCSELGHFEIHADGLLKEITEVDERFRRTGDNLAIPIMKAIGERDPSEPLPEIKVETAEWLEVYFYLRCHAALLSSTRAAMAGQISETYEHLRSMLENAMYAYNVTEDSSRKQIWLNRANDKPAVTKAFRPSDIYKAISKRHNAELGKKVERLYDTTIDDGAHPNVQAYLKSAFQISSDGFTRVGVAYLDPSHVEATLKDVKTVALACLEVFELVFPYLVE